MKLLAPLCLVRGMKLLDSHSNVLNVDYLQKIIIRMDWKLRNESIKSN
jgi:hypothetical protein